MAHPRVISQRTQAAEARVSAAAASLAEQHKLDPELLAGLTAYDRDPEMRRVIRQEGAADLLEALVKSKKGGSGDAKLKAENDDLRAQVEDLKERLKKATTKTASTATAGKPAKA